VKAILDSIVGTNLGTSVWGIDIDRSYIERSGPFRLVHGYCGVRTCRWKKQFS